MPLRGWSKRRTPPYMGPGGRHENGAARRAQLPISLLAPLVFGAGSLLLLVSAVGAAPPNRSPRLCAGIYKWMDEKGVTHYGQSIPPEYRNQAASEMTKRGLTVNRIDAVVTPEQRKAAEERMLREKEEEKRLFAQRRRDTALINTYTSAREIEEARERSLALPVQAMRGLEPRLKRAHERLDGLQRQADGVQRAGSQVPQHLLEDIADQKVEVDAIRAEIVRHRGQVGSIKAKFEADKQRYIELTQAEPR